MKKMGFTLVELLAVIILLAVILAITVPGISGIIEGTKTDAFEVNARELIKAIEMKRLKNINYNLDELTVNSLEDEFNVDGDNYTSVAAYLIDKDVYIDVVGKNKWSGLAAHGTSSNLVIDNNMTSSSVPQLAPESCYSFNAGNGEITGYNFANTACPLNLIIPSTIGGVSVDGIGDSAFSPDGTMTTCVTDEEETYIKGGYTKQSGDGYDYCYDGIDNFGYLRSVVIPDTVHYIDSMAFDDNDLIKVTFSGDGDLEYIGWAAFWSNDLSIVRIPSSVEYIADEAFAYNRITNLSLLSGLEHIGDYAFQGNLLEEVSIPNTVTYLSGFADNQLTSITIPNSVDVLGYGAFDDNFITQASIPNGVITIHTDAFDDNLLSDVTIPNSVTTIEIMAFEGNRISHLQLSQNLVDLSGFDDNRLTSLVVPSSVQTIGERAFGNNNLMSLSLPNGLEIIEPYAFTSNQLSSISIPNTVTYVGIGAFNDNQLPNNQAFIYYRDEDTGAIDNSALIGYGGSNRSNVVIPNNVEYVGDDAFVYCYLTGVTIPNTVYHIGQRAFMYNDIQDLSIPSSVEYIGGGAFNNNNVPDAQAFIYARGTGGSIDNTILVSYAGNKRDNVVIPSNVVRIFEGAFYDGYNTSITIPSSVTTIDQWAFPGNYFTTITIPNSVTSIGDYAFAYLPYMTSITIPASVTTIGEGAFAENDALTSVTIQGANPQRFNASWDDIGFPSYLKP